jgi:nicotinamide-nucleotide amidase
MTRAGALLSRARAAGWRVATAESCTGGLLAGAITEVPGSSDIFDRGFVTYSNAAKTDMLGVRESTLASLGAVSEPVAAEMAAGALARSQADVAVSVTGVAGPGGSALKPEGRVCFGLALRSGDVRTETVEFGPRGRAQVRSASVDHALDLLLSVMPVTGPAKG